MLTPSFTLAQDESHVIVEIEALFAHVKETEVFMDDTIFTFYSSPYYLRLHFSGRVIEDNSASAKYDADRRKFVIHVPKAVKGEHFENLDMLTALLTPKGAKDVTKNIEELNADASDGDDEEEGNIDWFVEQKLPEEPEPATGCKYGFAKQHVGVFVKLQEELSEVVDVKDPDNKTSTQRSTERKAAEAQDFDESHYLADTMEESETVSHLLVRKSVELIGDDDFSKEQNDQLRDLKQKNWKLTSEELKHTCLTLVDIIFAYCYDKRVTGGENNVESGWCISKLSASLSWLENHTNLSETVITSMRRSLCYPLYRNWNLASIVLNDTKWMFSRGRKQILKALLEIHCMLVESEPRYILNQFFIDDLSVWIQQAEDSVIESLAEALNSVTPEKKDMGLDLVELQAAANMVLQEEEQVVAGDVAANMHHLALDSDDSGDNNGDDDSDGDDEDDDDGDSTDSEDSTSGEDPCDSDASVRLESTTV